MSSLMYTCDMTSTSTWGHHNIYHAKMFYIPQNRYDLLHSNMSVHGYHN